MKNFKTKKWCSNIEFRGFKYSHWQPVMELDATKKALLELIDLSKLMPKLKF